MARTREDALADKAAAVSTSRDATPRSRGRPKIDGSAKKAQDGTGRPRGRPSTGGSGVKKAYVPTGRPRGRPPGSKKKSTTATPSKKPAAAGGKGRGRPRKSDASTAAVEAKAKGKRGAKPKKPAESPMEKEVEGPLATGEEYDDETDAAMDLVDDAADAAENSPSGDELLEVESVEEHIEA